MKRKTKTEAKQDVVDSLNPYKDVKESKSVGNTKQKKSLRVWSVEFLFFCLCLMVVSFLAVSLVFYTASAVIPGIGITLLTNTGLEMVEGDISLIVWLYAFIMPLLFMVLILFAAELKLIVVLWQWLRKKSSSAADNLNAFLDERALSKLGIKKKK